MSASVEKINSFKPFYEREIKPFIPPLSLSRCLATGQGQFIDDVLTVEPPELRRRKNALTRTIFELRDGLARNGDKLTVDQWLNLFHHFQYGDGPHISSFIRRVIEDAADLPEVRDLLPQEIVLLAHENSIENLQVLLLRKTPGLLALPIAHMFNVLNLPPQVFRSFARKGCVAVPLSRDFNELSDEAIFIDGWQVWEDDRIFTTGRAREVYGSFLSDDGGCVPLLLNIEDKNAGLLIV